MKSKLLIFLAVLPLFCFSQKQNRIEEQKQYKSEMDSAFVWLKKASNIFKVKNDTLEIEIQFNQLRKTELSGFALMGVKQTIGKTSTNREVFIITLNEVTKIGFEKNENLDSTFNLIIEANEKGDGIILVKNEDEDLYQTWHYDLEFAMDELTQDRYLNAMKHLLENNKLYIQNLKF